MNVRRMKRSELKEVVLGIEHDELYTELDISEIQLWVEREGVFSPQSFVISVNEEIVGFSAFTICELKDKKIIISLGAMAIKKEFQNQGIGRYLLETSLEQAKKHWEKEFRVKGLIIETGTEEATGFYEKVFSSFQKIIFPDVWDDGEGMVIYFIPL